MISFTLGAAWGCIFTRLPSSSLTNTNRKWHYLLLSLQFTVYPKRKFDLPLIRINSGASLKKKISKFALAITVFLLAWWITTSLLICGSIQQWNQSNASLKIPLVLCIKLCPHLLSCSITKALVSHKFSMWLMENFSKRKLWEMKYWGRWNTDIWDVFHYKV